eukprot:IDg17842t1
MASAALLLGCHILLATLSLGRFTQKYDQGPRSLGKPAKLSWTFDNSTKIVRLGLEVSDPDVLKGEKRVWVGIGVGEETSGGMLGADILTAEFEDGVLDKCSTKDRYVPFTAFPIGENPRVFPNEDKCQSWTLVSCVRDPAKGTVTLEVKRPAVATDSQDRDIGSGEQSMMYAYGNGDFRYHSNERGTSRIILFNADGTYPAPDALALPKDISVSKSILATNYTVPAKTTYTCTSALVELPASGKLYMVAGDPVIQSISGANKAHHLIAYACKDTPLGRKYNQTADCKPDGGPGNPEMQCTAFIYACK